LPIPQAFKKHIGLLLILIAYVVVAGLFALRTPPWQAPDEPAHYNYAAQVTRSGCCPTIEVGDWDSAYLDQLKAARFAPELLGRLDTIQYEDHQPPLYYLLQSVVYKLTNGSLIAMRLFSAFLGMGTIACAYFIARLLLPERPQVALGAAALVAFLPQQVAILASVNNDSLAGLEIGLTLLATLLYLKGQDTIYRVPTVVVLGVLCGLGLLTKVSTLFLVGVVAVAILLKWWQQKPLPPTPSPYTERGSKTSQYPSLNALLHNLLIFAVPVVILGGIWWLHSINVYGFPDIFGLRRHDLVVTDQARTADLIAQIGFTDYFSRALQTTFNSFWGQFGWMALPLPGWMYPVFLVLLLVGGGGLVLTPPPWPTGSDTLPVYGEGKKLRRQGWIILGLTAVLAVLAYLYYNSVFLQLQGRYLFAGIIPFAIGMALGVDGWRRLLLRNIPSARWLTTGVFLLLIPLDIYLILRVIEPLLQP
jgi:hypothetical protein